MGYVFDAMNRPDDENRPEKDGQSPSSPPPTPEGSVPDAGEAQEAAPPVSEHTQPTSDSADNDHVDNGSESPVYNFEDARKSITPPPVMVPSHDSLAHETETETDTDIETYSPPLRITSDWAQNLDDRLIALTEPSSQLSEEYRGIRTTLLARWEHKRHLIHTITSATPQEGKTITSLNLGLIMAELRNRKTIVIEADLRLPTFNKLLHLNESKGMIGYLRGEAELSEVIQEIEGSSLHIITAGSRASNDAVQLLSNQRMSNLLKVLRTKYDHVIIDTPPVIELADAGILGGLSDEVMLIARISRTPKPLIEQALRALRSYNAPVAGVIATDQERGKNRYHYYRYGYRYRYRYYAKRAA